MPSSLDFRLLNRAASASGGVITTGRTSIDFVIDGEALLAQLTNVGGGHADFMGCFVLGFTERNQAKRASLIGQSPPETDEGRVLLYVCPECGDIGCGAYAARVQVGVELVEWSDFAYENGYEQSQPLGVGPFVFRLPEYEDVTARASAVIGVQR
jgi:hypothetical protein